MSLQKKMTTLLRVASPVFVAAFLVGTGFTSCKEKQPKSATTTMKVAVGTMEIWVDPALSTAYPTIPTGFSPAQIYTTFTFTLPGTTRAVTVVPVATEIPRPPGGDSAYQHNVKNEDRAGIGADEVGDHGNSSYRNVVSVAKIEYWYNNQWEQELPADVRARIAEFTAIHEIGHHWWALHQTGSPTNFMTNRLIFVLPSLSMKPTVWPIFTPQQLDKIATSVGA